MVYWRISTGWYASDPARLISVLVSDTSTAQCVSVRITPTFGGGNATRAAPLQTELTRTLRWKCVIIIPLYIIITVHTQHLIEIY